MRTTSRAFGALKLSEHQKTKENKSCTFPSFISSNIVSWHLHYALCTSVKSVNSNRFLRDSFEHWSRTVSLTKGRAACNTCSSLSMARSNRHTIRTTQPCCMHAAAWLTPMDCHSHVTQGANKTRERSPASHLASTKPPETGAARCARAAPFLRA